MILVNLIFQMKFFNFQMEVLELLVVLEILVMLSLQKQHR